MQKVRCLFNKTKEFLSMKIDKNSIKDPKIKRSIKLTLAVVLILSLLVQFFGCCGLNASALTQVTTTPQVEFVTELPSDYIDPSVIYVTENVTVLKAGTYRFNDVLSFDNISKTYNSDLEFYQNYEADSTYLYGYIGEYEGEEYEIGLLPCRFNQDENNDYFALTSASAFLYIAGLYNGGQLNEWVNDINPDSALLTITQDTEVDDTFGTWYISNTNYNEVNPPSIGSYNIYYNDAWLTYENVAQATLMLLYGTDDWYSMTLPEQLSNYNGSFDNIVDMMNSTNYAEYEDMLQSRYDKGYNKGASDELVKGFFGNMFGGVVRILDSIHIYEEYSETGDVSFYISIWSIIIVILMVSVIVIILKVWRGN